MSIEASSDVELELALHLTVPIALRKTCRFAAAVAVGVPEIASGSESSQVFALSIATVNVPLVVVML